MQREIIGNTHLITGAISRGQRASRHVTKACSAANQNSNLSQSNFKVFASTWKRFGASYANLCTIWEDMLCTINNLGRNFKQGVPLLSD